MLMNAVGACVPLDGVGPTSVVVRTSTRNRVDAIAQPDGSAAWLGTAYQGTVRQAFGSAGPLSGPRTSTTARAPTATSVATTLRIAVRMTARRRGTPCLVGWRSCLVIPSRSRVRWCGWRTTVRPSSPTRAIHGPHASVYGGTMAGAVVAHPDHRRCLLYTSDAA